MYQDIIPSDLITRNFVNGITLILKYQTNAIVRIGSHDTICFGDWDIEMLQEDEELMFSWNWHELNGYWSISV